MFIRGYIISVKTNEVLLFISFLLGIAFSSYGHSCDCTDPPNCSPCEGNLSSVTLRYSGPTGQPNRYRVSDDGGQLANERISGDIVINSRGNGQPFVGNRLVIRFNVGGGFNNGIEILTSCNEIKIGQEYDNGNLTVISAVSAVSGVICCASEDVDLTPPAFSTCPPDVELFADEDCEAFYSWNVPGITDNCGNAVFVQEPGFNSGNFPLGETIIEYVAEDNSSNQATCRFKITVIDGNPFSFINCPSDIELSASSSCNETVTWEEPELVNSCAAYTLSSNYNPGDEFPVGTTEVIYTATDAEGNEVVCQFSITVQEDNPLSFINCPSDIELSASSSCNETVTWEEPELVNSCATYTLSSNYNPGDEFPVGTTEVIYTATDAEGNERAACNFMVTVIKSMEIVVSDCPSDIKMEIRGDKPENIDWDAPRVSGACEALILQSSHQPGDVFSLGETEVEYFYYLNNQRVIVCSFRVSLTEELSLSIPQLLTLNGDGINDNWQLEGIETYPNNEVIILDRWGSEVYKTSGYDNNGKVWSGENKKGNPVPTGTYFYRIKAITGSSTLERIGFLEVIR